MHAVAKEVVAACVELSAILNRSAECYSNRLEPAHVPTKAMVAAEAAATVNRPF
jgi:hypothetical protein